jgi:ABC-type transport system substrate-binding protein
MSFSSLKELVPIPLPRVYFSVFLVCLFYLNNISAQDQNHGNSRQIVIGDLVGRTDVRDLKILTKQGLVPILSVGNQKPFQLIKQTPSEFVLQYHLADGLNFYNPDQIVYKFYETERALISALILDEVDVAILENEASALEVKKSNPHFLPLPRPMKQNTVKMICYNNRNDLFKSRKVRQALSYAINRDKIIRRLLGGKANVAKGPFDTDSPLYTSGLESYNYNPKEAMHHLFEVNITDSDKDGILEKSGKPLRFSLFYQKGVTLDEAISRLIKIDLIKIGVDVIPKPLTKGEINDRLSSGDFEAVLMDYTFENSIQSLEDFFAADGPMNYMGYRSSVFENRLGFYRQTDKSSTRKTLIKSLQIVINQDQPVNFIYFKWNTHYMINIQKLDNYRDSRGVIRPFEEWIIKTGRQK